MALTAPAALQDVFVSLGLPDQHSGGYNVCIIYICKKQKQKKTTFHVKSIFTTIASQVFVKNKLIN